MLGNLGKGLELDVADVVPGKDDITTTKHGGNEDVGPVVRYGQIGDSRHGLLNDNLLQAIPQWYFLHYRVFHVPKWKSELEHAIQKAYFIYIPPRECQSEDHDLVADEDGTSRTKTLGGWTPSH